MADRIRRGEPTTHTQWRQVPADPRASFDLLAWIGWLTGGELIVYGLVALSRAGFDDFDFFEPIVGVGPVNATRLMAIIAVVVGLVIWIGTFSQPDEIGLRIVGAILLVTGIVWVIEPSGFTEWLGTTSDDGWHVGAVGALLVLGSLTQPFKIGKHPPPQEE